MVQSGRAGYNPARPLFYIYTIQQKGYNMDDATQEDVRKESEDTEEPTNSDVIEDTDADTRDIEDTNSQLFSRIDEFFKRLDNIDARLDALSNAQAIMIENGATIREVTDDSSYESDRKDEFVPLDELDFTI